VDPAVSSLFKGATKCLPLRTSTAARTASDFQVWRLADIILPPRARLLAVVSGPRGEGRLSAASQL